MIMRSIYIKNLTVYTETGVLPDAGVVVKDGIIKDISACDDLRPGGDCDVIEFTPKYSLIPGMIDMHVHGALGADVMDGKEESLERISENLPREGVTAFLATTMTGGSGKILNAVKTVKHFSDRVASRGAAILGIHLEGPFISAKKVGAQDPGEIKAPDISLFNEWQNEAGGLIKIVTLAPEEFGALDFIKELKRQGVIVSAGHTDASFEEAVSGIKSGLSYATHLFNAMSGKDRTTPGAAGALLTDSRVTAELIVDGVHLDPSMVKLALKVKTVDGIILVTDAIKTKGLPDGTYTVGCNEVCVENGAALMKNKRPAGSVLKMNDAVKNMINLTGCGMRDIVKMTSTNQAKLLGIFDKKGSIKVGKDADLVVLDENMEVALTMRGGKIVWSGARGEKTTL
ncbi:MAG: N-acetylglucosamine-6-phosphate deacetylase [Candidatus Omnitrophica bacterium]|nr:N-acetylglucosamine-6-phosphate deacetylase [Candidatus Omnitrophota bacterium]